MKSLKKKFLAGILSGAVLFAGGLGTYTAHAADKPAEAQQFQHMQKPQRGQHHEMSDEEITNISKHFAEHYGVKQSEVEQALKDKRDMRDVQCAAMFAKISNKSFSSILAMKMDWKEIGDKLGITKEQIHEYMKQEMSEKLAKESSLDVKTVNNLIKDGYNPRDIEIAGRIANASNSNVNDVLAKKQINNKWSDIAKELDIDLKTIMPKHDKKVPKHGPKDFQNASLESGDLDK